MIVVLNHIIPFQGFKALTLWPFVFVRRELSDVDVNHEHIHGRQQIEMLIVPFLLWYCLEWMVRLVQYGDAHKAYRNISFECEANAYESDMDYLKSRRFWAWLKFI